MYLLLLCWPLAGIQAIAILSDADDEVAAKRSLHTVIVFCNGVQLVLQLMEISSHLTLRIFLISFLWWKTSNLLSFSSAVCRDIADVTTIELLRFGFIKCNYLIDTVNGYLSSSSLYNSVPSEEGCG
ncbi:hypothetical protein CHARACLAT_020637 [Characodon lateralis]|uniref:Uncharacterized protein n=1 Tax=Characodon lateralis TaxID=208331 RepID=A0ABU7DSR3_9TELE|nr:hypothetical protein [Characodon lateralis]